MRPDSLFAAPDWLPKKSPPPFRYDVIGTNFDWAVFDFFHLYHYDVIGTNFDWAVFDFFRLFRYDVIGTNFDWAVFDLFRLYPRPRCRWAPRSRFLFVIRRRRRRDVLTYV